MIPPRERFRFRSIAEMIFDPRADADVPIFAGPDARIMLRDLRRAAGGVPAWATSAGLSPGDSVALFRIPGSSEIPLATTLVALLANGFRVLLPMTFDESSLPAILDDARAALWWSGEEPPPRCACPVYPDLVLDGEAAVAAGDSSLVLTTSGSSGEPKLFEYAEESLLRVAEAWKAAGLMDESRTGGTSVCPLVSHSMGVRNLLHAVWNRHETLLVPPEWLAEHPHRVVQLLIDHPPQHLTCGPALFRAISEYLRTFPALRERGFGRLRCVVSSGAPFNPDVRKIFPDVVWANAFGMTETQQVLTTLLGGAPTSLGRPLPGVDVDVRENRLFVRTSFGAEGVRDTWFDTGDLVDRRGEDLHFVGRANGDFIKNGLGIKMPLQELGRLYGDLFPERRFFPEGDGILALHSVGERDPADPRLHAEMRERVSARLERLGDFPSRYLAIRSVGFVGGNAIHRVEIPPPNSRRANLLPRLSRLQELLDLDSTYVSGEGDVLVTDRGERVLDVAGGFGANLLGHGHPELRLVAEESLRGVPILDQFSARPQAQELGRLLARRVGAETGRRYVACLASTGSEAVEIALKHAMLERSIHKPVIVALEGGFHGKTLGALNVLSRLDQREPFAPLLAARTVFLPPRGGPEAERRLAEVPPEDILAVLVEPVLGEGGIVEVPPEWMAKLRLPGVPLIFDEIQCGLGRTGTFLAAQGIRGDYYLFGKALGGGVAKIAAVLIDRERYVDAFDELQGSTFAGDTFSSSVALRVLEILERDRVPDRAREAGRSLREKLEELRQRFPRVIREVRGRGLMLGLELSYPDDPPCAALRALAERGLGYVVSSFLLRRHRIRIFPTTSAPNTLRIEPSVSWSDHETDWLLAGLESLCRALDASDLSELVGHLVGGTSEPLPPPEFRLPRESPASGARRVAFVHHPIHPAHELVADSPGLAALSTQQRLELFDCFQELLELRPIVSFSKHLFEGRIWMAGITIPATPAALDHLHRHGHRALVQRRMQEALDLAASLGCEAVSFGGYTSIVTEDCTTLLPPPGTRCATGNTFTIAVALRQIRAAGFRNSDRVAVVGALGNIGAALARELGPRTLRVGRPGSEDRLRAGKGPFTTNLDDLRGCDFIVLATSGSEPILFPRHVAPDRPVVVADLSQPRAAARSLRDERPNTRVFGTGLVRLPHDPDFLLSTHSPPGTAFACATEAILMGLAPRPLRLTGPILSEEVRSLDALGEQFGLFDDLVFPE